MNTNPQLPFTGSVPPRREGTPGSSLSAPRSPVSPEVMRSLELGDLIELVTAASLELKRRHDHEYITGIVPPAEAPQQFAAQVTVPDEAFVVLPARLAESPISWKPVWRFTLLSGDPLLSPIAVKAVGDVIVGRKVEGVNPDLDLTIYDTGLAGISRVHALIRPTEDQLQVSDLGSTNGTYLDGQRLRPGTTAALKDGSVLSFSKLHFMLRIIERPD